jgi:hypothetical protein
VKRHPGVSALWASDATAAQCTICDKSSAKNWLVALHQDRRIPVMNKVEAFALSGWSEKEGGSLRAAWHRCSIK